MSIRIASVNSVDINDSKESFGPNAGTGWFSPAVETFHSGVMLKFDEFGTASNDLRLPVIYKSATSTHICKIGYNGNLYTYIQLDDTNTYTLTINPSGGLKLNQWYFIMHQKYSTTYEAFCFEVSGDEFGKFDTLTQVATDSAVVSSTAKLDADSGRLSFASNHSGGNVNYHIARFYYSNDSHTTLTNAELEAFITGKQNYMATSGGNIWPVLDLRVDAYKKVFNNWRVYPRFYHPTKQLKDIWFEVGPVDNDENPFYSSPISYADEKANNNKILDLPIIKRNVTKRLPNNPILDLENPINRDIALCVCPGIYGALNLVNGKSGTNYGKNFHGGRYGMSKSLFNGESAVADSATNYLKGIPYVSTKQEFTLVWVGRADVKTNDCGLFTSRLTTSSTWAGFQFWCKGTNANASPYVQVADGAGGTVSRATGAVDFMNTAGSPDDPGYDMIAAVRYNGDGQNPAFRVYYNGYRDQGGDATGFTMAHATEAGMGAYYDYAGWYSQHGKSTLGVYWDRAVSNDELASLAWNPFQIFKTVQSRMIATDVTSYTKFARIPTKRGR